MIVIEKKYLPEFLSEKEKIKAQLQANFVDIIPIEILNDLFILPDSVVTDDIFKEIFVNFKNYSTRIVAENEFIKYEI